MFPLLLLLLLGQTLPCPRRDSVTVILKSQPALFVTLANTVHSMWACTAVAHVGGGFMQTALDGTLSLVLGVLPCSSGVRGIPTYACHWHLDRRTLGIVLSDKVKCFLHQPTLNDAGSEITPVTTIQYMSVQ
jgi:hypothetical protein